MWKPNGKVKFWEALKCISGKLLRQSLHLFLTVSVSGLHWFFFFLFFWLGKGMYHFNLLRHSSSWSQMLLLGGVEKNKMIRTCVVGIWESRKQMRSGWQKKPQSKIHTGERSCGGGEKWAVGVISLELTDSGGRRTPWAEGTAESVTAGDRKNSPTFPRQEASGSGDSWPQFGAYRVDSRPEEGRLMKPRWKGILALRKWVVLLTRPCPAVIRSDLEQIETCPQADPSCF